MTVSDGEADKPKDTNKLPAGGIQPQKHRIKLIANSLKQICTLAVLKKQKTKHRAEDIPVLLTNVF